MSGYQSEPGEGSDVDCDAVQTGMQAGGRSALVKWADLENVDHNPDKGWVSPHIVSYHIWKIDSMGWGNVSYSNPPPAVGKG